MRHRNPVLPSIDGEYGRNASKLCLDIFVGDEMNVKSNRTSEPPDQEHWLCVPLISSRHLVEANQTLEVSPRWPGNGAGLAIRWNEVEEGN